MTEKAPRYDWESIRAEFEAGASTASLARKWGPSRAAIQKQAKAHGWEKNAEQQIRAKVRAKLANTDRIASPVTREEAIEAEASRRVAIVRGHQLMFERCRTLFDEALALRDDAVDAQGKPIPGRGRAAAFEAMKLAKISTEAARNTMLGERLAHGIAEGEERPTDPLGDDDRALLEQWRKEYADAQGS